MRASILSEPVCTATVTDAGLSAEIGVTAALALMLTAEQGPAGPPGPAGAAQAFVYTQSSPASTWTVNHNLGAKPTVTVFTVGGVELEANVVHLSVNQLQVLLAAPMAGSVRCI